MIGLVAEDEPGTPESPPIPIRYLYSPYGEAHAELGPELRRLRFDNEVTAVAATLQSIADSSVFAGGALRVTLSLPLDPATLANGVEVEHLSSGGWAPVAASEVVVGLDLAEPNDLLVMLQAGWQRGASYRVRLASVTDMLGRVPDDIDPFEWNVPRPTPELAAPPVIFEQRGKLVYESFAAAGESVNGRFPGGQYGESF